MRERYRATHDPSVCKCVCVRTDIIISSFSSGVGDGAVPVLNKARNS